MKDLKLYIEEAKESKLYVDGILISPDNKILILRRANYMKKFGAHWGFVGGSVESTDKTNYLAIIREIKEETNIDITYNERTDGMYIFDSIKHDDGTITEYWVIKLDSDREVKISREHAKAVWVDIDDIQDRKKYKKFMPGVYELIEKYYKNNR